MFSVGEHGVRVCEGLTRRQWLRIGGLGAAGLGLSDLLRNPVTARESSRSRSWGRGRSCILCFLFGAPTQQDIWDLEPDAPADVRGEFRPIATSVPGIRLGEHIPRIARSAQRFALVRSVQHPDNTHTVAMHHMLLRVAR
jgi:hypothetical protein